MSAPIDNNVYALNASTGAKLWSYATGGTCVSPRPQWRMGWFISAPIDGNVYALNASTGAKLWSYATGRACGLPRPQWRMGWFISAPSDGTVYALNASTGAMLWSYPTAMLVCCSSSPAVANGVVYVGTTDDGNCVLR